ncbi:MAG: HD domain-containing phosphohydrolase, partial [Myxococcota bacterium]
LSAEEWVLVRKHPEYGAKQLKDLDLLRSAVPLVLSHHERWDGTGYPKGLRRKTIPLVARVFAVCDAFEAMTADRPYRKAAAVAEAQEKIANERGKAFDPEVVDAFMTLDTSELLIAGSQRASLWPSLT